MADLDPGQRWLVRVTGFSLCVLGVWGGWAVMGIDDDKSSLSLKPSSASTEVAAKPATTTQAETKPEAEEKPAPGIPGPPGEIPPPPPGPGVLPPEGDPDGAPIPPMDGGPRIGSPRMREKTHINQLSVDELAGIPGVGQANAVAIDAWRKQNGPFPSCDDLIKVPGLSPNAAGALKVNCSPE